ncbi:hypothetical protein [Flavobacterium nitrogenifigens]|uniref:Uncharacterized protein n=1 Tax=Flavobacterium nitrogenifigens TaxID=1617283 RepID=A0A521FG22_9FLAO|nr:hypothetical protein [Flavobacterium nitrogenifigens]KAF2338974.1 hypothetical protein DM397_02315 [Flavobacterium nitrogenifigens]SMO94934.1 hypothetical protein SAMN06265220_11138 [Flavobacterium nitrogenifigens]
MNAIFDKVKNRSAYTSETSEPTLESTPEEIVIEKPIEEDAFIPLETKPLPVTTNAKTAFETLIEKEIETMLQFNVIKGKKLSSEIGPLIETKKLSHQIVLYEMLKEAIHPATPKSIHYINQYRDKLNARVVLLKIKLARQFTLITIISILLSGFGYAVIESDIFIDKYIFTDTASFVINQLYIVATAFLGAILYFFPKLIKQVNNSTLTAAKIPFYWLAISLGSLSAIVLINTKVFAPYLIDDTFLHNLFIAAACGFVADILYGNIQAIAHL